MAVSLVHNAVADATFSATGAANWNAEHTLIGTVNALAYFDATGAAANLAGSNNAIPFWSAAGVPTKSSDLIYVDSTKLLTVGNGSGTSKGFVIGYGTSSGFSAIWSTAVIPSTTNYIIGDSTSNNLFNADAGKGLIFSIANVAKMAISSTAGTGPSITAGTATTDVAALSVTRTNNNAAVATGIDFNLIDTTSAAGYIPFQLRNASANLFRISKAGVPYGGATTFMIGSTGTWASGAGVSAGTLLNAPSAGNPTKWIPVDDNGTTRYVPAW